MATGTLTFNEACQRVILAAKGKKGGLIQYAASYAQAGLSMTDREMIQVQSLSILHNLVGWRGYEARMVKATLREFAK